MKRTILLMILFFSYLILVRSSYSEENVKILIRNFAPGLSLSIPQGGWKRLDFKIVNNFNESLIIFYHIEKPSGIEIEYYPPKYYSLNPNAEIAGNFNISIDPYLEVRSYTVNFWIDTFEKFGNETIRSNEVTLNLTVLSNPSFESTTTTTTPIPETTVTEVTTEVVTTVYTTEVPVTILTGEENHERITHREYFIVFGMIIFLLILFMSKRFSSKETVSAYSQEQTQA